MSEPARFRVVEDGDTAPIPHSEANRQFGDAFAAARSAYVSMLDSIGNMSARRLLLGGPTLSRRDVQRIRDDAATTATRAAEMLMALDVALDITVRAVPDKVNGGAS